VCPHWAVAKCATCGKGHDTRSKDGPEYRREAAALSRARKEIIPILEAKKNLITRTIVCPSCTGPARSHISQPMSTPVSKKQNYSCDELVPLVAELAKVITLLSP